MPVTVPPAINYPSPLLSQPDRYMQVPPEGARMIPCEIDWGTMGSGGTLITSMSINLQNNSTKTFTQICSLAVDNSACCSDVQFVFPDTAETMTIPAYTPKCIVPVFTKALLISADRSVRSPSSNPSMNDASSPDIELSITR